MIEVIKLITKEDIIITVLIFMFLATAVRVGKWYSREILDKIDEEQDTEPKWDCEALKSKKR